MLCNACRCEPLEPRRMLAVFNGTAGDDSFELSPAPGNRIYEIKLNGQVLGTTQDAQISMVGLGGNDTFDIDSVYRDNIVGTPYEIEAVGGQGDDAYLFGNAGGTVRLIELLGQGSDRLILDETDFDPSFPPTASGLTTQTNSINNNILFDDNLEGREVHYGEFELNLTVTGPIPAGLTLVLGNRKNKVTFVGNNKQIDEDFLPGRIFGGSGEDTVIFDDSLGNRTVHRDYSITGASFLNQSFNGVDKAEIKTRLNTTATANTVFMTGAGTVLNSVTFSNADTNVALTPTRLSIGTQATPIDLDNLALQVNAKFISRPQLRYEIWDHDANLSGNPYILDAQGTRQIVQKGPFIGAFDDTQFNGEGISLQINGGSTGDLFRVSDVLPLSRVTMNGGGGDDTLLPVFDVGHGQAPEQVFLGTSFTFDGGDGSDTVHLDDSTAPFFNTEDEYQISTGFTKNGRLWMTHRKAERVNFIAGGARNIIRIDTRATPDNALDKIYSIDATFGNDTITNVVPGLSAGALGANVIVALIGGIGSDSLVINDTLAESLTNQYTLNATSFSYAGPGAEGSFAFSGIEDIDLDLNGRATNLELRAKATGVTLNIDSGAGNDTFIVGGGDLDNSGLMSATGVTLNGNTGVDNITFDDRQDLTTAGETETYTFSSFSLAKGTASIGYSTFETLTLLAADGVIPGQIGVTPVVNMNALNGFLESATINGGANRGCIVNVGVTDLNNIAGVVNVNTATSLTVNEAGQTFGATSSFEINDAQVKKTSNGQTINYSAVGQITLNTRNSAISDSISVKSIPAGTSVIVNANAGDDNVAMGNGNVDANLLGPVTINGGSGSDRLSINNGLDGSVETLTLNAGSLIDSGITYVFTGFEATTTVSLGPGPTDLTINGRPGSTNVFGGSGNDTFTVGGGDIDANFPAAVTNGLYIDAGGGTNTLRLNDLNDTNLDNYIFQRPSGLDQFMKRDGTLECFVTWENMTSVTLDASNAPTSGFSISSILVMDVATPLRINGNAGGDAVQINDAASPVFVNTGLGDRDNLSVNGDLDGLPITVTVDQSDDIENLSIFPGGTLRVTNGATLLKTRLGLNPAIDIFGVLDLGGGALVSRSGGPTPAQFRTQIIAGRNGGAWNGSSPNGAINSSLAAGSSIGDGVGYGLGSEVAPTSLGGFTIAPGDTLLRYTLDGDADLSGAVNLADFNRLAANFGQSNRAWVEGNSNYDVMVNLADFNALAGNFGQAAAVSGHPSTLSNQSTGKLRERLQELS